MRVLLGIYCIVIFLSLVGCAQKHKLEAYPILQNAQDDGDKTDPIRNSIQGEMRALTDDGLYVSDEHGIYVKTDGKPIIAILDELAYKSRMNYTIVTPLPKARLTIFDLQDSDKPWNERRSMRFETVNELFVFLEKEMNRQASIDDRKVSNYKISMTDDGVIVKSTEEYYEFSYKKIFLYNLTVEEAQKSINEFFFKDDLIPHSFVPIEAQNALIIQSIPEILDEIGEVIHAIDSNVPQVMIESQVFEYDDSIGRRIGMALDYSNTNEDITFGIKTIFGENITDLLPQVFANYNNVERKQSLLTALALQDRDGGVKIMAEPRLVLKPGKQAFINLNTVKYVIVSGVNYSDLKQIDTGIVFKITPTILSDSTILLDIHLEQSEFIPTNEEDIVQSINKNVVNTSIVVNDGELVSIGGIYIEKSSKFASGIPLLRDIPGIGFIFGSQSNDSLRMMVEFMIRPTIKNLYSRSQEIKKRTIDVYNKNLRDREQN